MLAQVWRWFYLGWQTCRVRQPTTAGDLHLMSSSPAIDTGANLYVTVPFDLDFLPRIRDGLGDKIAIVDMGVYEYPSSLAYAVYSPLVVR